MGLTHSVRAQVVVYENELDQLLRLAGGLGAAARLARDRGGAQRVELVFGDCSEAAPIDEVGTAALRDRGLEAGLDAVDVESFGANLGHSGGHNRLAAGTDADALLILNPDTYPAPTMLAELIDALEGERVAVAEARQVPFEHPKAYDMRTGDTSWASGAGLLVRRGVFVEVGGFDAEHFWLYVNDVDLSWRIRLAGHRVVHVPSATLFHDKQIDLAGHILPTANEERSGLVARLLLALRYARPDAADETIAWVRAHGSEAQRSGLAEFEQRKAQGALPRPLVGAERVATFIDGEYAVHRF